MSAPVVELHPVRRKTLEVPAVIAGNVNLVAFSGALAQAGIVGRYDADRGTLVIEPANAREPAHDAANARIGMAWWNSLPQTRRRYWLEVAGSARPADAWRAFQSGIPGP